MPKDFVVGNRLSPYSFHFFQLCLPGEFSQRTNTHMQAETPWKSACFACVCYAFLVLRAKILGDSAGFFCFSAVKPSDSLPINCEGEKKTPQNHFSNSRFRNIIMASSGGSAGLQCLSLYCHRHMVRPVLRKSRIQAYVPSYANLLAWKI